MSWRDLIEEKPGSLVFPWVGGREIRDGARTWAIEGRLPREHGWYSFETKGRKAKLLGDAVLGELRCRQTAGYLVGDFLVPDVFDVKPEAWRDVSNFSRYAPRVHLIDPGMERFARIRAGAMFQYGPLIYAGLDFPLGPETEVQAAFEDRLESLEGIKGVTPSLEAAFRFETWVRAEIERRRAELERQRREEEARLAREAERAALVQRLGDGAGRRAMAKVDFHEAARAALAIGEAELLDVRDHDRRGREKVVRFRYRNRRFECVCDDDLHIVDAGICLENHATGERGDQRFTLESLPGVVGQAIDEGRLHVWRHA